MCSLDGSGINNPVKSVDIGNMNLKNGIIVSHVIQRQYNMNNCASKIKTNPVCSVYSPAIGLYL